VRVEAKNHIFKTVSARLMFKKEYYQDKSSIKCNMQNLEMYNPITMGRAMLDHIRKIKAN